MTVAGLPHALTYSALYATLTRISFSNVLCVWACAIWLPLLNGAYFCCLSFSSIHAGQLPIVLLFQVVLPDFALVVSCRGLEECDYVQHACIAQTTFIYMFLFTSYFCSWYFCFNLSSVVLFSEMLLLACLYYLRHNPALIMENSDMSRCIRASTTKSRRLSIEAC